MSKYAILYVLNGKQHIFYEPSSIARFAKQSHAVAFFWGYNPELRGRARVIATLRLI
jgi:hypothetical protein